MFRAIRWRIALPYVGLILISMLSLGVYLSSFLKQTYISDREVKLPDEARMIGEIITPDLQTNGALPNLDPQAKNWADILNARVTILAPDGTVWGESNEDRAQIANHSDRPEVVQALASGVGSSSRFSHTLGYEMLYTVVRVEDNKQVMALVRVALPLQQVSANIAHLQRIMIAATVVVTLLAVLLATLIAGRISRPVRELTQSAWKLSSINPSDQPIPSNKDEISQLTSVFNIMSSRLSGEIKELEKERATLEAVVQKMTDGVLIVDARGDIQLVNPAAEKMFSLSQPILINKPLIEIIRHHQPVEMWQRCRDSGETQNVDFEVGDRLSLHGIATSLSPVISGSTLLLFQDMTRQRQIETMSRDFISNVSHELRTPLAALKD